MGKPSTGVIEFATTTRLVGESATTEGNNYAVSYGHEEAVTEWVMIAQNAIIAARLLTVFDVHGNSFGATPIVIVHILRRIAVESK